MFNKNILSIVGNNSFYERELVTGKYGQVRILSFSSGERSGKRTHKGDEVLIFLEGAGRIILKGEETLASPDRLVFVPAGEEHEVINVGSGDLKFYSILSEAELEPGFKK